MNTQRDHVILQRDHSTLITCSHVLVYVSEIPDQVQTVFANQPFFPQTPSLQLPSSSDSQKLTPNNYHTWSMFMQIILESAGVWIILSNPNAAPIPHQLQMDARAKALMVHGMSSSTR